jgi:hypothetical protein
VISNDIQLGADFFLPPGGMGGTAGTAQAAAAGVERGTSLGDRLAELAEWLLPGTRHILGRLPRLLIPQVRSAAAGGAPRGATESYDRLSFLVSKDIGDERWSISLNLAPMSTQGGGVQNEIVSVTGNVFRSDGSPPAFVFCSVKPDSQGTLSDPSSIFRLACVGTDACQTTASDCAANQWRPLADVEIAASFFLPPEGLPAAPQSSPDIVIIGNTSDPPSIGSVDFTLPGGTGATDRPSGLASCNQGADCLATTIGDCTNVPGTLLMQEGVGCVCVVTVPSNCVQCGSGATGSCGEECAFAVGTSGSTARGVCLPFSDNSNACSCRARPTGQDVPSDGCGGPLRAGCPSSRCCADDPSDGCDPSGGQVSCAGVCVDSGGCDPSVRKCGNCFGPDEEFCGNGIREGNEVCDGAALGGRTCASLGLGSGQLGCTQSCRLDTSGCSGGGLCGNGVRDGGEECDGADLGNQTCGTLGFLTGTLGCTPDCEFDTSSCAGSPPTPTPRCMGETCQ